jgi:hypothetical protein
VLAACLDGFDARKRENRCELTRPQTAHMDQATFAAAMTACSAECKAKGPAAQRERETAQREQTRRAADDKAREARGTQDPGRRDACVTKCEQDSDRKCAGLPDTGLVGQQSLCLRDALKACCGPCGTSINTNNFSMCTH